MDDIPNFREGRLRRFRSALNHAGEAAADKMLISLQHRLNTAERVLEDPQARIRFGHTRDKIPLILAKTGAFHGTGAKQYPRKWESPSEAPDQTLQRILRDGLQPQYDPLNTKLGFPDLATISLSRVRRYAQLYASLFQDENEVSLRDRLDRVMGWTLFLMIMAGNINLKKILGDIINGEKTEIRFEHWTRSFRNDGRYSRDRVSALLGIFLGSSDIRGNFPVIIGVRNGGFSPLQVEDPFVSRFEIRSSQTISPHAFTHLEVPYAHVSDVEALVKKAGLDIPVIPLEFLALLERDKNPLQEIKREGWRLETSAELLQEYETFQSHFPDALDGVVYYPCCGNDVSPSAIFDRPGCQIVYLDQNPRCVELLQRSGFRAHQGNALISNPGPVKTLILQNPEIAPEEPAKHIVPGGYLICNNYHETAEVMTKHPDFECIGVVGWVPEEKRFGVDQKNLQEYFEEVETDEAFAARSEAWRLGSVQYEQAVRVVEKMTGKKDHVLDEYRKMLQLGREQRGDHGDLVHVTFPDGTEKTLCAKLPWKKGYTHDLYIFRKRSQSK